MTMTKAAKEEMAKKDNGTEEKAGKKRKSRELSDEDEAKEEENARQRQEEKRKANNKDEEETESEQSDVENKEQDTADTPADTPGKEEKASEEEEKADADEDKTNEDDDKSPGPPNEQQQQQAAAIAAAMGNPLFTAGMPLAAVAGMDPSSPQANFPFFLAQQGQLPFGAPGMPMGNQADQSRLLQGLVANRPGPGGNNNQQQQQGAQGQGQENGAAQPPPGGQVFPPPPPLNAAALQQLYSHPGMDPTQMMMMGFPPGLGGNPFMPMRPGLFGAAGGRMEDVPLANLTSNLYRSPSIPLGLPCDDEHLSEYQILVRQQLELFEAEQDDVDSNTQGRKKAVVLGQVGLRCRHCAGLTLRQRGKGSVYYPTKLTGIYQAAQNMASTHLSDACQCIDDRLKVTLMTLRQRRDTASGGKQYWADGAKAIGLYETEDGLRLSRQPQQQF